jgi:polysaccharide biosynthesis protein VpsM
MPRQMITTIDHNKALRVLVIVAIAALLPTTRVTAFDAVGDDAELFATGLASAAYNDNIFLSHTNAKSDDVFDLVPGLSYEFGKRAADWTGQLAFNEDFQIFSSDGGALNNEFANAVFWTKYDDSKTKLNFDASFHQADQAEVGIQNVPFLVNRDLYHADGTGEWQVTDKSSVGTGLIYDDTDYRHVGFDSWQWTEVPVNYYYKFEPKLDLSAGFRFRDNTLGSGGLDSDDYYYNIGARGEFTPLLTGQFDVGYDVQELQTKGTQGGLGADSSFTLAATEKTSVTFGVTRDYAYAPGGSVYLDSGGYAAFNSALDTQWSVNGRFGYDLNSYTLTTQRDNIYSGKMGISYAFSTCLTFAGSYTYSEDSSNVTADSFTNNIFSVSASLHY